MKKCYTENDVASVGWLKVFAAIGWVAKMLSTLCLVVVSLALKALASFMKSK
jgi:hypothetical protein